jgi:hypothetical protein
VFGQVTFDDLAGTPQTTSSVNKSDAWLAAIGCSLGVSVLALVCIVLIGRKGLNDTVQLCFVGLGAGSMLGKYNGMIAS